MASPNQLPRTVKAWKIGREDRRTSIWESGCCHGSHSAPVSGFSAWSWISSGHLEDLTWIHSSSSRSSQLEWRRKKSVYFCFGFKTRLRFLLEINMISKRRNERIRFSDKTLLGMDGGMDEGRDERREGWMDGGLKEGRD